MSELKLPSGHIALLDDDDLPAVLDAGPWRLHPNRHVLYAKRRLSRNRSQMLHQFLTGYPMTDHANGNGLDNRRANLRPCNDALNAANRIRLPGKSGYRGVTWHKASRRWESRIRVDYHLVHLGIFATPEEAARAYDAAAIAAWGEYARPNFPRVAS